ncbi:MAG: hypothetical protein P1P89_19005 [Desulfobacterales bacterium]|nr:hypothetical protein [Desulfobacterales bacterium]
MKKTLILSLALPLLLFPTLCPAQAPSQIGGFVLGANISEYKDRVKMETAMPIRYAEYLTEVEMTAVDEFKSGLISYGNCAVPGGILRIKLKYADSTKKFYEALLKHYKARFGEPLEWRGDPFHIMIAWKWSFTDSQNNQISMILQHNTKDEEEKLGNAVKITLANLLEQERICFEKKYPDLRTAKPPQHSEKKSGSVRWDRLLPK